MKIGLYLTDIKPSDGGIFQYSHYLLKMLLRCNDISKIYLFHSPDQSEVISRYLIDNKIKPVKYISNGVINNSLRRLAEFWLTRYHMRKRKQGYNLFLYKLFNPDCRFLNRYKIDLLHVPRQHSPAYNLKYPVIITMHDIQHFHFPEFFTPLERIHKAIRYNLSMKEADHIIVSFKHVKEDLAKYFKEESEKASICPVPLSEDWNSEEATSPEVLRTKYNLPQKFILTPAATWQHKNHIAVLEAMNILRGESFTIFWIATGFRTSYFDVINQQIKKLKLENQVLFTGIVPENDLRGLYNIADLVVIPTLYEAGSGPLVEAMRYNVPVICSNVTSLPEMIGNNDFVFSPYNFLELAGLIKRGLTDAEFISKNKENSEKRIELYNGMNYTVPFVTAYSKAIDTFKKK